MIFVPGYYDRSSLDGKEAKKAEGSILTTAAENHEKVPPVEANLDMEIDEFVGEFNVEINGRKDLNSKDSTLDFSPPSIVSDQNNQCELFPSIFTDPLCDIFGVEKANSVIGVGGDCAAKRNGTPKPELLLPMVLNVDDGRICPNVLFWCRIDEIDRVMQV